jgi:hypothetical protein
MVDGDPLSDRQAQTRASGFRRDIGLEQAGRDLGGNPWPVVGNGDDDVRRPVRADGDDDLAHSLRDGFEPVLNQIRQDLNDLIAVRARCRGRPFDDEPETHPSRIVFVHANDMACEIAHVDDLRPWRG